MSGRLQETVAEYRRRLLAQEASAVATLEASYAQVLVAIQPQLDNLYRQIDEKQEAGERVPPSWLYEQNRLTTLKFFLQQRIDQFAMLALNTTGHMRRLAVTLGTEAAQALLRATVPLGISWSFGVPSAAAMASLIGSLQLGSPLARLFRGFGLEAARLVGRALVTGLTLGWNPRRIAPLVESALNAPRWRALTIARTESLRSYRSAQLLNYRENEDVLSKWRWTAAKQKRTCIACLAMDGTLHDLNKEFGSHPNCRCTPVPVTKSWDEILGGLGIDASDIPDTRPTIQTGKSWFEKQNEATQRTILGNAKYEAYKEGKFELDDVVGHSHDSEWGSSIYEKSLKELIKA